MVNKLESISWTKWSSDGIRGIWTLQSVFGMEIEIERDHDRTGWVYAVRVRGVEFALPPMLEEQQRAPLRLVKAFALEVLESWGSTDPHLDWTFDISTGRYRW